MRIPELTKRPAEMFSVGLRYQSPDLDEGGRIVAAIVNIIPNEAAGLKKTGNVVIENDTVSQMVYDGEDGHEYYVEFKVTTSGGHVYEDAIFVKVREITE